MGSNKLKEKPMVSVWMITYNHGKYIRKALDGILMQKVDFTYEIVVGEDCSQDNTRDILLEYKEKYPDKIKLILHEKNVGMEKNQNTVFRQCKGKYVANCEGDDYWTDPYKLRKQVEFLENHPEYIGTAHRMQVVDKNGNPTKEPDFTDYDGVYTIKHVEKGDLPGQTATLVYRNIFGNNPSIRSAFEDCKTVGDRKLALCLALNGNIYRFNEVMSHYRHVPECGDSWSASIVGKNMNLVYFNSLRELSLLAQRLKYFELDYTPLYMYHAYMAFWLFVKKPNLENFEILKGIFKNYNNKTAMVSYILKRSIAWPARKVKRYIVKPNNF